MSGTLTRTIEVKYASDAAPVGKAGEAAAAHAEGASKKITGALSGIGGVLKSSFGGAFAPVGEAIEHIVTGFEKMEGAGNKAGKALTGIGATATGLGTLMVASSAKDVQSLAQLKTAVETTGGSWEEIEPKVEAAIKAQEKFGNSADETQNALNSLTLATHSPEKALEALSVASDVAAKKHLSLSAAADLVGKAYNGNTKILKEFGIHVSKAVDTTKMLEKAEAAHAKAVTGLSTAQQKLTNLEEIDAGKKKLTIANQIALRTAHENVAKAQALVASSAKGVTLAQEAASKAGEKGTETLNKLGAVAKGQASASVSGLAGQFKVLKVQTEDAFNQIGAKAGPALTAIGPPMLIAGQLIQTGIFGKIGSGIATQAGNISRFAQHMGTAIASGASGGAGAAVRMFSSIGSGIASAATSVASLTASVAVNTATWLKNTAQIAANKIAIAATVVWQGIVRGATAAWAAVQWVLDAAMDANPVGIIIIAIVALIAIIVLIVTHLDFFKGVWAAVWGWIVSAFQATVAWFQGAIGNLGAFFTVTLPGMLRDGFKFMMAPGVAFINWFVGLSARVGQVIRGVGNFFLVTLPSMIRSGVTWVINAIASMPGNIMRIFNNLTAWVGNIGRNIVIGLWNGISGLGGWLWSQVTGFAENIINTMMSALGIHSPSTKANELIGKNVAAGVGQGLDQNQHLVIGAADRLANAALPNIPAGLVGAAGSAGVGAQQLGDINITIPFKVSETDVATLLLKIARNTRMIDVSVK